MSKQKESFNPIAELTRPLTINTPEQNQQERDTANQLLGRIQLGQGIAKLVTVTTLIDLQKIKETKTYRHLSAADENGKPVTVTSWEQFCGFLGYSREKVDNDLLNLAAFGAEALDGMQRAGLGYRDLRKLRRLPDEDRTMVLEAFGRQIETDAGDKDAIKEAFAEMLDAVQQRHAKEKTELEARLKRAESDNDGNEKLISIQTKEITSLKKKVLELEEKPLPQPDEQVASEYEALQARFKGMRFGDSGTEALRLCLNELSDNYYADGEMPMPLRECAANGIAELVTDLRMILQEFNLENAEEIMSAMTGEQFDPTAVD
jgi:hypothetical protein